MRPLPEQIVHRPFGGGPFRMAMDLVTLPESAWFELDQRYLAEMAEKRHLLATAHDDVFAAMAGTDAARAETFELIMTALTEHHPGWFSRDGSVVRNHLTDESWTIGSIDPLELAGRLVQEDLCLIQRRQDGPVFTAAVLCFPSRWKLAEKIGKPLLAVHQPVPLYAARLGRPVDWFMQHLKPGRIASRMNWSLLDDPALFQPGGKWRTTGGTDVTKENAGSRVFLRVERQTFRLLPTSLAIVFGIRVHVYPLSQVIDHSDKASALAAAVQELPVDVQHYKSLLPMREAVTAWLQSKMS